MLLTPAAYNLPLVLPGSYFNGRAPLPPSGPWLFPNYSATYHIHYLRYLYYLCYQDATGPYPTEISYEEIAKAFSDKGHQCKKKIRKILIGEAPNVPGTYFYNPATSVTSGGSFYSPIVTALFPAGTVFANRIDFLMACARAGFLLMDLFPYDGGVYPATPTAYRSAFCGSPQPYTYTIIQRLYDISCCLEDTFSIAFSLIRIGNPILSDPTSVAEFNDFLLANRKALNPAGPLDALRGAPIPGASDYVRVVGKRGPFGPVAGLLTTAGF